MGKVWAVDAIAKLSRQNWTPLTVPLGFWRDQVRRNVSNSSSWFLAILY